MTSAWLDPTLILWLDPAEQLPVDEQWCLLMLKNTGRFYSHAFGPVAWRAQAGVWTGILSSSRKGALIVHREVFAPGDVYLWTDWERIEPPDEEPGRLTPAEGR